MSLNANDLARKLQRRLQEIGNAHKSQQAACMSLVIESRLMKDDAFFLKVAHALTGCQLVEQELKLYITEALDLVRKRLGDRMPFRMCGEDYEDAPLERLIQTFTKLTTNADLVSALSKFKKERNFLSHKAIAHCLDPDDELSIPSKVEVQARMDAIQTEADRLRVAIHEEANKFRGPLYFEDLPE